MMNIKSSVNLLKKSKSVITTIVSENKDETKKEKPIKDEPTKDEPIKEKPIKEKPINDEPINDEPINDEPINDKPIKDEPIKEKPIKEKPIKEKPIKEKPTKDEPTKDENTLVSIYDKKYKTTVENATHFAYAKKVGLFNIPQATLIDFIVNNPDSSQMCLVDIISPYFMFFWDIDMKKLTRDENVVLLITTEVCKSIMSVITENVKDNYNIDYIYCDKAKENPLSKVGTFQDLCGIHLYFPNIIIDVKNAKLLTIRVKEHLLENNTFNLTTKEVNEMIDDSPYNAKKGLKMLYQSINNTYYKINVQKSTYKVLNKFKDEKTRKMYHLKLTSIKTTDTKINFTPILKECINPNIKVILKKENKEKENKEKEIKNKDNLVILENNNNIPLFETPYMLEALKPITKDRDKIIIDIKKILTELVSQLNPKIRYSYPHWFNLAACLSKFGQFGENLINIFSKKSNKYDMKEIATIVSKSYNNIEGYTFKSLLMWFKEDTSEILYLDFIKDNKKTIDIILETDEKRLIEYLKLKYEEDNIGLAEVYCEKFKDDIICVNETTSECYMFNYVNKLWEKCSISNLLKHFMIQIKILFNPLLLQYSKEIDILFTKKNKTDKDKTYLTNLINKVNQFKKTKEFTKCSSAKPLMGIILATLHRPNFLSMFDSIQYLLSVKNGIVNLKTGEFRERLKEDYCTFERPIDWKGLDYPTPTISKFIDDIMLSQKDVIEFLQLLCGYLITGYVNQQLLIFLTGVGSNGKGILMFLFKKLMGQFYRQCTKEVIITCKQSVAGEASPHIMQLMNARVSFIDESDMDAHLNESAVKYLTGGASITGRPLYGQQVTFEPTSKIILLTNHKPNINVNKSIGRRLMVIPFLAEFVDETKYDKNNKYHKLKNIDLENILNSKLDEFLVWVVKGSKAYFTNNESLGVLPKLVQDTISDYLKDNDLFTTFKNDTFVIDENGFVPHKDAYMIYNNNPMYPKYTSKRFSAEMTNRGCILGAKYNTRGFYGVSFRDDGEDTD
jgi:P4 family phage/plasmid primase-like protien